MRNGFAQQTVPESRVDFTKVRLDQERRDRDREIALVLDQVADAARDGDLDETLRLSARLASLRNRSTEALAHYGPLAQAIHEAKVA